MKADFPLTIEFRLEDCLSFLSGIGNSTSLEIAKEVIVPEKRRDKTRSKNFIKL